MIDQEQKLVIPWLVIPPPEEGTKLHKLLVSSPDGQIVEFFISLAAAEKLPEFLSNAALWQTFFSSLINSLEMNNV